MATTTSSRRTGSTTTRGREKKEKKTNRTLGIVPFSITPKREELREFEHVFVYGVLELLGLMGKVHTVELAPCYPVEELERRRDSGTLKDTRDLIRTADARAILTGSIDASIREKTDRVARAAAKAYLTLVNELKAVSGADGCAAQAASASCLSPNTSGRTGRGSENRYPCPRRT